MLDLLLVSLGAGVQARSNRVCQHEPPRPETEGRASDFIFETRKGPCISPSDHARNRQNYVGDRRAVHRVRCQAASPRPRSRGRRAEQNLTYLFSDSITANGLCCSYTRRTSWEARVRTINGFAIALMARPCSVITILPHHGTSHWS
jgi:hypothetical protein